VIANAYIKKQVQELFSKGIVKPNSSSCGSHSVLVPKKNGMWRICIDFRALNNITIKKIYHIPRIDDLLDWLKNVVYFNKIDVRSGYHHIIIAENDIWKTSFKTRYGLFELLVMPFLLCNAPATFMRVMNDFFRPYIDEFLISYIDDIFIFIQTWEDHIMHVKTIFQLLKKEKLYIKMSKCEFGKNSLVYSGYIVGNGQLNIDTAKVEVILNGPIQPLPQISGASYDKYNTRGNSLLFSLS
jgi:hypothetical protein